MTPWSALEAETEPFYPRGKRKALPKDRLGKLMEKLEQVNASIRTKVEHPFHVDKNLSKHRKPCCRGGGLAKNTAQFFRCSVLPTWCSHAERWQHTMPKVVSDGGEQWRLRTLSAYSASLQAVISAERKRSISKTAALPFGPAKATCSAFHWMRGRLSD